MKFDKRGGQRLRKCAYASSLTSEDELFMILFEGVTSAYGSRVFTESWMKNHYERWAEAFFGARSRVVSASFTV